MQKLLVTLRTAAVIPLPRLQINYLDSKILFADTLIVVVTISDQRLTFQ